MPVHTQGAPRPLDWYGSRFCLQDAVKTYQSPDGGRTVNRARVRLAGRRKRPWRGCHGGQTSYAGGANEPQTRAKTFGVDPLRVVVFLLMFVILSRIHHHFAFIGRLRPALLLTAAALVIALAKPGLLTKQPVLKQWPALVVIALGVSACLSVPFGISLGNSASFILEAYGKVLVISVLLMLATRNSRDISTYVWAYVLSMGVLVWMAFFVFQSYEIMGVERLLQVYSYDTNDLALVLAVGIPLVLWQLETGRGVQRAIAVVVLLVSLMAIARTGSRGGLLALVGVGLGFLLLADHFSVVRKTVFAASALIALLLVAPQGYWERMETIVNPTGDYNWTSTDGRLALLTRGFGYMASHPVFGIGINNFARAEGTISSKARRSPTGAGVSWTAPHNSYIEVGAEMGVPAMILWAALPIGGLISMYRLRRRIPRSWRAGEWEERFLSLGATYLAIALLAFAVSSAFLSFAYMPPIYLLTALVVGVRAGVEGKLRSTTGVAPSATFRRSSRSRAGLASRVLPLCRNLPPVEPDRLSSPLVPEQLV